MTETTTAFEKWINFLKSQNIAHDVREYRSGSAIGIDNNNDAFSGYGVGVEFDDKGNFIRIGGWA